MRTDLFAYVRELSFRDKKDLSKKALKLSEECGELASAVLPFENASGTTHRFVTKQRILEECVDSMLVALSIAYTLDFKDDDISAMMKKKTDYWGGLLRREARMGDKTPYEIHITVNAETGVDAFIAACRMLDVKPIVLDLQRATSGPITDVMTSSVCFGKNSDAYYEMQRIAEGLQAAGFEVVRKKIETVPWHPAAPARDGVSQAMPLNCYFESHLGVQVQTAADHSELAALAQRENCHLSRNTFKTNPDGTRVVMMTYRVYDGVYEDFQSQVAHLVSMLKTAGFVVDKEIIEFSLFDSKVSHDAEWLRGDSVEKQRDQQVRTPA